MRILIVGNGGREHTLLWKLKADHPQGQFFATLPNGGMLGECEPVEIAPTDIEALTGWASSRSIDLTVVGPEAPLAGGIADRFRKRGLPVFGPTQGAAKIESSKAFAKDLMKETGVPTADYETFSEAESAIDYIRAQGAPIVVKASGLAAGKGAIVCPTVEEAVLAVERMLGNWEFGEAGREVVIEECMTGEELSIFGITDGEDVVLLLPSQDHKRVGEGDVGPNTGGMGAYAPVSVATPEILQMAREKVFEPTLRGLAERGTPFQGLLYAGLMLTPTGPRVVEFNCRFGDPETQVVLPMLASSLLELLVAAAEGGGLSHRHVQWHPGAALTTVVASEGYPGSYAKGLPITVPEADEGVTVFHAGTRMDPDGSLKTSGGRVVAVTARADTLSEAADRSRSAAEAVSLDGKYYRRDIGWRELERLP